MDLRDVFAKHLDKVGNVEEQALISIANETLARNLPLRFDDTFKQYLLTRTQNRVSTAFDKIVSAIKLRKSQIKQEDTATGDSGICQSINGSTTSNGNREPSNGQQFMAYNSLPPLSSSSESVPSSSMLSVPSSSSAAASASSKSDCITTDNPSESPFQIKIEKVINVPQQDSTHIDLPGTSNDQMGLNFSADISKISAAAIDQPQPAVQHGKRKDVKPMVGNDSKIRKLYGSTTEMGINLSTEIKYFHNPLDSKPFTCKFCPKSYDTMKKIDGHLSKLHSDKFPYQCKNCDYGYLYEHNWKIHESKCTRKTFQCYVCKDSSQHLTNLKYHMCSKHIGEGPYSCNVCSERFYAKWHVKRHKKKTHNIETN